jgi:hypothetical protein
MRIGWHIPFIFLRVAQALKGIINKLGEYVQAVGYNDTWWQKRSYAPAPLRWLCATNKKPNERFTVPFAEG